MTSIFTLAGSALGSLFRRRQALILENLALRQQLAVYERTQKRPTLRPPDRAFWVCLSRFWSDWRTPLVLVKPDTLVRWYPALGALEARLQALLALEVEKPHDRSSDDPARAHRVHSPHEQ